MSAEAGLTAGTHRILAAVLAAAVLAGCTVQPSSSMATATAPRAAPASSMTVPTSGASRQDDACRSLVAADRRRMTAEQLAQARSGVVLATEAGAGPVGTSSAPAPTGASTPEAAYARCMKSARS